MKQPNGLILSVLLTIGCSSSQGDEQPNGFADTGVDGQTTTSGTDGQTASDSIDSADATDDGADGCEGTVQARGYVSSTVADIIYNGQSATAEVRGTPGQCATSLSVTMNIDGGCELSLEAESDSGAWALTSGSFTADANCGSAWPSDFYGEFPALTNESTAGVLTADTIISTDACGTSEFYLAGRLRFASKDTDTTFDLFLNGLSLKGQIEISESDGACPQIPSECEGGESCGRDLWGFQCGTCDSTEICTDGACEMNGCPDLEPLGTNQGNYLTDVEVYDCDGEAVALHDLCGQKAGMFYLLAGW